MADNDVTVTIGVDTTGLDAGMARVKAATQGLGGAAPSGAAFDPIAAHVARYKDVPKENAAALQGYGSAAKEATGATNELSEAQDGLATSTERAASGFERMLNRMMMRMGILLVIHEAIKLVTEALQESSAYEAATVRWESLTRGAEGYGASLEDIKRISAETGISRQDLMGVEGEWKKIGVSTDVAGASLENLAKYAKILGVDVGTVAQEFGRVELKRGSVQDMQDLAYATHNINLQQLVNDLAEAQRMAPILAQQQAELDRQINRAADDQDRALNRAIEDTERLRNAQLGVAQAMHLAGRAFQEFMGGGRTGGPAGQMTERLKSEMALGEKQLAREGEPSARQMRDMGVSGREVYQILMAAAQRYHEQVRIAVQRQEEDQKRIREQGQEDARTNVRLKAAQDLLGAEDAVAKAIEQGVGAGTAFAAQMDTAEGKSDLIKQHIKEVVDDTQTILDAVKGWNTAALGFVDSIGQIKTELKPVVEMAKDLAGFIGQVGQELGKLTGLNKPSPILQQMWPATHDRSPADILRSIPFGLGQFALPQGGGGGKDQNQNDANKKHDETNKTLGMIHDVLRTAFA